VLLKLDKNYIKIFEPLPPGEFLEIREFKGEIIKSVWISKIEELKAYKPDPKAELFIQQYTKGNKKDRTSQNSKSIKHLWFDIDDNKNLELVLQDIKLARLPKPSLVLNSGGGFHIYYYLNDRTYKDITPILKSIAPMIKADSKATDIARIMRLESSHNNKDKYKNKPLVEVVYQNDLSYDLSLFEKIAGINAKEHLKADTEATEPLKTDRKSKYTGNIETGMHCVDKMLKGVKVGQRNFALGRITKKLQQLGYQKYKAKTIIMSWNNDNQPPENKEKLLNDFEMYWEKDYKLLGCQFNNPELQQSLKEFCDKSKCQLRTKLINIEIQEQSLLNYSNELLKDNKYHRITGNALVVYGLLKYHDRGLNRKKLKEKLKSAVTGKQSISDRLLGKKLKELEKLKLIEIHKRYADTNNRKSDLVKITKEKDFNLGYTLISHHVIKRFIDGAMSQAEFKVYLLLRSYIYTGKSKAWPTQEKMSYTLKISQQTLSEHLKNLEKKDFIKIDYIHTEKGYPKAVYRV
jgi:DNA-binding HxlR family transcriptional regulator